MKTKNSLVKTMFMNILTAGVFTFAFTACSDELESNASTDNAPTEAGDYSLFEPYGLTYQNFENENDVRILNADTTEIAISKKLADKMGITSFVNHPLGIWQGIDQLPYARKAIEEKLVGDMYILKVAPATVAELVGDKEALLNTSIYVNNDVESIHTRAASDGIPEFSAKYVDENNVIHPAVIHLTDPYGYDNDIHMEGDPMDASQTRAAESGHYQYMTAEELAGGKTRFSVHPNVLSLKNKFNFYHRLEAGKGSGDTITISGNIPVDFDLNYFLTLNSELKWKWCIPYPSLKKFESGFDGKLAFSPEAYIGFSKRVDLLGKDNKKKRLCTFGTYSFTFMVGVVPINIQISPNLYMKFNAMVEGGVRLGFKYEYKNQFKVGVKYENGEWGGIKDFKEVKNDFNFEKPQAYFNANAGIGLFFGLDVMLYGVAGPEMGVGPSLDAKASLTIKDNRTDWQDTDWTKDVEFKGSVGLTIKAYVGAKVSFLGYELGNWSTDIDLIDPWILKKYPSDGTEHKSPAQKEEEGKRATLKPVMDYIYQTDSLLKKDCEDAIFQLMQMHMMDRGDAVNLYYDNILQKHNNQKIDANVAQSLNAAIQSVEYINNVISNRYAAYVKENYYKELDELVRNSQVYQFYTRKLDHWENGLDLRDLYKWFKEEYGHDPRLDRTDVEELMSMMMQYSKRFYMKNQKNLFEHYNILTACAQKTTVAARQDIKQQAVFETIFFYYVKMKGAVQLDNDRKKKYLEKSYDEILQALQDLDDQREAQELDRRFATTR